MSGSRGVSTSSRRRMYRSEMMPERAVRSATLILGLMLSRQIRFIIVWQVQLGPSVETQLSLRKGLPHCMAVVISHSY